MPVIIRIDGKAFHTWTKQLKKDAIASCEPDGKDDPFSHIMHGAMSGTTLALVKNMQNAVLGYTQSDEISILLNDWKTLTTDQWFGGGLQKIASVSASAATANFNQAMQGFFLEPAMFDARVFNIPKEEVVNYFVWRQQDATRNSVQMLGRHYFSHKELHKNSANDIMDKLVNEKEVYWNGLETWKKRGTCVLRGGYGEEVHGGPTGDWIIRSPHNNIEVDDECPIFSGERWYIERLLSADSE